MYLFKRGFLPNYFRDMFTLAGQIHSYNTQKNSAYPIYLSVELIFENSQFGYLVLSFQLPKSGNSKQWKYQFVWQKT